jgi:two-component system, OmpR family, phosphate regulon sensor histidine kinase PhoR
VPPELVVLAVLVALVAGVGLGWLIGRNRYSAGRQGSVGSAGTTAVRDASAHWVAELPTVIDLVEVGVVRVARDMRIVGLNQAAARMLSTEPAAAAGRTVLELFIDHRVEDAVRSAPKQGTASIEIGGRAPDERRTLIRIRRAGDAGYWLLLDDVTELRRLQRIRTEFVDNLSHELRTPLTTIRLLTETLGQDLEHADVPPRIRERTKKIDVETGHLVQMVNELLDLARIEGGAAEQQLQPVDMAEVINGALDRLRAFAERQEVTLVADLPPGLPPAWGDDERLGQVLVNLLHNAVKFSPSQTTVTVAPRVAGNLLAVEVRDQGVGIPATETERVFERFYKVDKARQRGMGGTGLGLAIARHIIEGHGGTIAVESVEGHGARFTFTVPLADRLPADKL